MFTGLHKACLTIEFFLKVRVPKSYNYSLTNHLIRSGLKCVNVARTYLNYLKGIQMSGYRSISMRGSEEVFDYESALKVTYMTKTKKAHLKYVGIKVSKP